MRPYFETKVVKVKKKEKPSVCPDSGRAICLTCGEKLYHIEKPKKKSKGNWVNGENLDKIKFPVPCSYVHGTKKKGMLLKLGNSFYVVNVDGQGEYNQYFLSYDLKHLIEDFNIHILKGKIIIFEEE